MKLLALFSVVALAFACDTEGHRSGDPDGSTGSDGSTPAHLVDQQGDHGFVGTLDGSEAFIAIVTGLEVADVLVVHGDDEIYERFEGDLPQGYALDLKNEAGARLNAEYLDGTYRGDVTLGNGNLYSFSASVIEGDVAGMFLVLREDCAQKDVEAGWIIDSSGTQRGAFRVQSKFADTPVLDSDTVTFDRTDYSVFKIAPPKTGGPTPAFPDVCKTPAPAGPVPIPYPG